MAPEVFTEKEWRRLNSALQSLGEVGALSAIVEAGTDILAKFDTMAPLEQMSALGMAKAWPHEEVDQNDDELPPRTAIRRSRHA